jgi:hypothetical protein
LQLIVSENHGDRHVLLIMCCLHTGWEKAEAEAVALKQQLDAAWQQKLATEDRATHLDGALKECMKQLRHVREEQEQLIHDTLVKKTREYDKVRIEMETKLAEASEILSHTHTELLECRAEGKALSHALQVKKTTPLQQHICVLNAPHCPPIYLTA